MRRRRRRMAVMPRSKVFGDTISLFVKDEYYFNATPMVFGKCNPCE